MMETAAQKIGKLLQEKRENLGFSLQDIAQKTRIRKVYLENMEAGQLDGLPGQAYVVGFVRVYASHLGLDSNTLLALLDAPQDADSPPSLEADVESPAGITTENQPAAGKGWGAFVLGFIVVITLGALFYFVPPLFNSEAPLKIAVEEASKAQEPVVPQRLDVATVSVAEAVIESVATPSTVPKLELETTPVVAVAAASNAEEKSSQRPLPTISLAGSSLRMLALTESSLIIHVDEREPHEYKLYQGLDLTWKIKKTVRVELAAPDVAQFWLDRQNLSVGTLHSFQLKSVSGE
jgi:cytoskeleton protein RodZ